MTITQQEQTEYLWCLVQFFRHNNANKTARTITVWDEKIPWAICWVRGITWQRKGNMENVCYRILMPPWTPWTYKCSLRNLTKQPTPIIFITYCHLDKITWKETAGLAPLVSLLICHDLKTEMDEYYYMSNVAILSVSSTLEINIILLIIQW
jgi:hypothetical protein